MHAKHMYLFFMLSLFASQSYALNQGGFEYKEVTGSLKPTPGCKNKQAAAKHASTGYRFKKQNKVLCQKIGYGWRLDGVEDSGEIVCESCEGMAESVENYRCYVKNVRLKCVLTKRGW